MRIEGADGAFCSITPVHMGGHKLILDSPALGHQSLVFCTGLVVEDLEIYVEAVNLEARHDVVIHLKPVLVRSRLELGGKDHIGIAVVSDHYILVATAASDWEASTII